MIKSQFAQQESLVEEEFEKYFNKKIQIFNLQIIFFEKLLYKIAENKLVKIGDDSKYAISLLASIGLKSFISSLDRLSKGYLGDSESLLKRPIEGLIIQSYFFNNPEKAKEYIYQNKEIRKFGNRADMSKIIDQSNIEMSIFPTDENTFFQKYVYQVLYDNCNKVAHMNFEVVHQEIGLDNDNPKLLATNLVIGPKFDKKFMEITLNRILMTLMYQISLVSNVFKYPIKEGYNDLFKLVTSSFVAQ